MRVLFTTNSLVGHWRPMLPLARAAVAAGHDVVVATGPDLVPDVEERGLAAWTVGPDLATIQAGLRDRHRTPGETPQESTTRDGMAMFAVPAIERARDLRRLTTDWTPDLVVREIYELGGAYVPAALHVLHGLGAHYPGFVALAELALAQLTDALGEPAWRTRLAETPYVDPFPPVLQPPEDRPFSDVVHVRPDAGDVHPGDVLPGAILRLPYDRTVYLSLGTFFDDPADFAVPLAALRGLDVNVVVTTGPSVDPAALGALPPNMVALPYVPQALLLPRCHAVLCHGGAGTIIGALTLGVPLVCLPRGADQFSNAAQVARTGAAITLPPDAASPDAVHAAVRRVLNEPAFAAAAAGLQRTIAALPSPASVVEQLAARAASRDRRVVS